MIHSEMVARMSSYEFNQWVVYHQLRAQDSELAQAKAEARHGR